MMILDNTDREIDVLGTKYMIKYGGETAYPSLKGNDGSCDTTSKVICILNEFEVSDDTVAHLRYLQDKVLRHEIIHAYLYESGLSSNCYWAENEEIVDWFAIQLPKITKTLWNIKF